MALHCWVVMGCSTDSEQCTMRPEDASRRLGRMAMRGIRKEAGKIAKDSVGK